MAANRCREKLPPRAVRWSESFGAGTGAGTTPTADLRLDPRLGRERQGVRGEEADRLEREGEDFFAAIALSYEDLAAVEPERIRAIDAAQAPEVVLADAIGALADLLG